MPIIYKSNSIHCYINSELKAPLLECPLLIFFKIAVKKKDAKSVNRNLVKRRIKHCLLNINKKQNIFSFLSHNKKNLRSQAPKTNINIAIFGNRVATKLPFAMISKEIDNLFDSIDHKIGEKKLAFKDIGI